MLDDTIIIRLPVFSSSPQLTVVLASDQETEVDIIPDQEWYWSPRWQAMEAEADRDLAEGRFHIFDTVEEFLSRLDAQDD
jgi:hypothetical protein